MTAESHVVQAQAPGDGPSTITSFAPDAVPTPTYQEQIVQLVNVERAKVGLQPLKLATQLAAAADGYSNRMAVGDFFGHCDPGPPEAKLGKRITDAGYNFNVAGEIIAAG